MERRPSLLPPADTEHYNDLSDLERDRHENDMRLKNTFEHIFDKYSRDFSTIGDEIDLETGEIVVNNGHLVHLEDERDTGEDVWASEEEEAYEEYDIEEEDELLSSPQHIGRVSAPLPLTTPTSHHRAYLSTPRSVRPFAEPEPYRTPQSMDLASDPAFFQALGQSIAQGIAQYMSSHRDNSRPTNSVWDAPPLPRPSRSAHRPAPSAHHPTPQSNRREMVPQSPRHPPARSVWASERPVGRPRVRRSSGDILAPSPIMRNHTAQRQALARSPERFTPVDIVDDVQYSDEEDLNAWAGDEDLMELVESTDPEGRGGDMVQPEPYAADPESPATRLQPKVRKQKVPRSDLQITEPRVPARRPQVVVVQRREVARTEGPARAQELKTPAKQISESASPSSHNRTRERETSPGSNSSRKRGPSWTRDEHDLLIELKEVRKMSILECCRFFPTRTLSSIGNHYYRQIANRPKKDAGEPSEFVRRALENEPILAKRVSMKPENTRPNFANLQDHGEGYRDSNEENVSRSSQECDGSFQGSQVVSPEMKDGIKDWTKLIRPTGDAHKPWACVVCEKAFRAKAGASSHVSISACKLGAPQLQMMSFTLPASVTATPPSTRVQEGTWAMWDSKILVREQMEEPYLCTRCGRSWLSSSGARRHSKQPAFCIPKDWPINYAPARKRKAEDSLTGTPQPGTVSKPKRTKLDNGIHQQLSEAAQTAVKNEFLEDSRTNGADAASEAQWTPDTLAESSTAPARRGLLKRFTVSDKAQQQTAEEMPVHASPHGLVDTSKVMKAVQQYTNRPLQMFNDSMEMAQASNQRSNGESSARVAKKKANAFPKTSRQAVPAQKKDAVAVAPIPHAKQVKIQNTGPVVAGPSVAAKSRPEPKKDGASLQGSTTEAKAKAVEKGTPLKAASSANTSKSAKVKGTPLKLNTPKASATQSAKAKAKPVEKGTLVKAASSAKVKAKAVAKATPLKSAPASHASQVTQSARAAVKTPSQSKSRAAMTPQAKCAGAAGRSSPLSRTIKSEPRAISSFMDLLADESEDELAF